MNEPRTLAIDIGGTGIKAALLDDAGRLITERRRVPTPSKPVAPAALVHAIDEVATPLVPSSGCRSAFRAMCARDGY